MKNITLLTVGALLLAGCATKEMKSTPFYDGGEVAYVGEASDRVNLWPVAYWRNPVGAVAWPLVSFSDDHFALRPIYSQYKQTGRDGAWDEFNFAWPIVQADTKRKDYRVFPVFWGKDFGGRDYQAVFPIYWNGPHYNSLFPIWYYGSTTNAWHFNTLAGLVGASRKESDFAEKVALIDSPTLPDCVKVSVSTNTWEKSKDFGKTFLYGEFLRSADETVVLLHDADHSIRGPNCDSWYDSPTNKYEIIERYKRGHKLLFNYESERTVAFDLKTKAKLSDKEENGASLFVWLYDYKWNHNRNSGDEYTRHRILWRLWDWKEKDGNVSLDVFPGFTYDSRKDGYAKTSLLWRLFRYERDPNAGTSVDFLFIPVWR